MNRTHLRNPAGSRLLAAAFAILSLSTGVLAQAGESAGADTVTRTTRVAYGDLDLSTEQGNRAFLQRLTGAASRVCPVEDIRNLAELKAARVCRRQALDRAVSQVHNERLAALLLQSRAAG